MIQLPLDLLPNTDAFDDGKSYKILFPGTSQYRTDTIMVIEPMGSQLGKKNG